MPLFVVTETQSVLAVREIEAETEETAYTLFCQGQGREVGADGVVTNSVLVSVELVEEAPDEAP